MYKIVGTESRKEFKRYYICKVNSKLKKDLGKYVVIHRDFEGRRLQVIAECYLDDNLDDETIAMDQTLREALAVSRNEDEFFGFNELVNINRLELPLKKRLENTIGNFFGFRYIVLRFNRPTVSDAEKNIVKVSLDSLKVVGVGDGDTIIMEYAALVDNSYILKSAKAQAFDLDGNNSKFIKNRLHKWNRFENYEDSLDVIEIDFDIRCSLATGDLQPIYIRRDVRGLFLKQFRDFGMTFLLAILAIFQGIDSDYWNLYLKIILAIVISVAFSLVNIRSSIK